MPDYRLCPIYTLAYTPRYTRRYRLAWKCIEIPIKRGHRTASPPFAQDPDRFAQLDPGSWPPGPGRPDLADWRPRTGARLPPWTAWPAAAPPPRQPAPAGKSTADHPLHRPPPLPCRSREGRAGPPAPDLPGTQAHPAAFAQVGPGRGPTWPTGRPHRRPGPPGPATAPPPRRVARPRRAPPTARGPARLQLSA